MKSGTYLGVFAVATALCAASRGADWITAPSHFTHDPQTGTRVDQYTPVGPFYSFARSDYLQSGYRHTRSTIQAGQSMDQMHIVEEWGRPVRPYGEWQRPFRPYSVPYQLWGAPYAGLGSAGWDPYRGNGMGAGSGTGTGWEDDADPYGRQSPPPYQDDRDAPSRSPDERRSQRGPLRP